MRELKLFRDSCDYGLTSWRGNFICSEAIKQINPFLYDAPVIKIKATEKNPKKKGWTKVLFYTVKNNPFYNTPYRVKINKVKFYDFYPDCVGFIENWCREEKAVWIKVESIES